MTMRWESTCHVAETRIWSLAENVRKHGDVVRAVIHAARTRGRFPTNAFLEKHVWLAFRGSIARDDFRFLCSAVRPFFNGGESQC